MASRKVLVLIHGMGAHTSDSFKKEVIEASNNSLQRYPSFKNIKFEDQVHIESISYDDIFEKHRKDLAKNADSITEAIKKYLPNVAIPNVIEKLLTFEQGLGDDKFENSHILDVLLYLTLVGAEVRAKVTVELAKVFKKYNDSDICILAHSLGTAVAHDSMDMLFTDKEPEDGQLPISSHKIHKYWAFANVSRIIVTLSGKQSPLASIVKPGGDGCLGSFGNVYNELDPFVLDIFKRFNPARSDGWINPNIYEFFYQTINTKKVSRINTHSIKGYIEDPDVCHEFLNTFFSFLPSPEEKKLGDAKFKNIESEFQKIKKFIGEINSYEDIVSFINALKEFKDFLIKEGSDELV
jgi:hypothetical protein